MILSNLTVPLLGAVDTAVVGHLDHPYYLGAVAVSALIFNYLYWSFGFLRMGTTGLVAQAVGAGDGDEIRAVFGRAASLGVVLGAGAIILQVPIISGGLALLDASAEVETLARDYFDIRIWSAPAVLVQYAMLGWFLGVQNTRAVLALQVFTNGLNVVLDLWFVMGLGWGVEGVALATVISECSGALLGAVIMLRVLRSIDGTWRLKLIGDRSKFKRLVAVNRDLFVRTFCLLGAFAWLTAKGAQMGDVILAANAVLLMFQSIMSYGLDGFAHAAEALVGSALGAKNRSSFRQAVRVSTIWAALVALLYTLMYWLFGYYLVAIMTDITEVRRTAAIFMPWMILSPMVSVWGFLLDGVFIGATETRPLRTSMILALAAFILVSWIALPIRGNHGLWFAFIGFMGLRGVLLGVAYPKLLKKFD